MQRITYNVMREHLGDAPIVREVEVHATPEELDSLERDGYLVREGAIEGDWLESLRSAIDRMAEAEWPEIRPYSGGQPSRAYLGSHSPPPARQGCDVS